MSGTLARSARESGRVDAADCGPRQYRDDARSRDARTLYRAYHLGCADHRLWCAQGYAVAERSLGGCRPHHAGPYGSGEARADDGTFAAGERRVTLRGAVFLSLLLAY